MSEDSRKYYWLRNIVELAEENYKKELKRATNYVGEIAEKLDARGTDNMRLAYERICDITRLLRIQRSE